MMRGTPENVSRKGTLATGSFTTTSLASGISLLTTITHGLGTDDIDFGMSLFGGLSIAVGGLNVTGSIVGVDKRYSSYGNFAAAPPTIVSGPPESGDIDIWARNNDGTSQPVTVNWWARVR